MQKIKDLFRKDIYRKIEEVIKVDQADQETVRNELEEYIATDTIKGHFREVLDAYLSAKSSPAKKVLASGFLAFLVPVNPLLRKSSDISFQIVMYWVKGHQKSFPTR